MDNAESRFWKRWLDRARALACFFFGLGGLSATTLAMLADAPGWLVFVFLLISVVAFVLYGLWLNSVLNPPKTDEMGHMSPDERDTLKAGLALRGVMKCPMCGCEGWSYGNHYLRLRMHHSTMGLPHTQQFAPAFPVYCNGCGLILLYNPSGIFPPDPDTDWANLGVSAAP